MPHCLGSALPEIQSFWDQAALSAELDDLLREPASPTATGHGAQVGDIGSGTALPYAPHISRECTPFTTLHFDFSDLGSFSYYDGEFDDILPKTERVLPSSSAQFAEPSAANSSTAAPSLQRSDKSLDSTSWSAGSGTMLRCWQHGCGGRRFSSRTNYRRHIKEKANELPKHICGLCGMTFTRKTAKAEHQNLRRCRTVELDANGVAWYRPLHGNQ